MPASSTPAAAPDLLLTLLQQMFEVSASLNADVRQVLSDLDLSESTSGLLWMLDPDRPPLRMREIAQILRCDPSNVTLIGDKLEHAGLVTREAYPHDRRSRVLVLTDAGNEVRQALLTRLMAATPLSTLTAREQHQLGQLLSKLSRP